MKLIKKLSIATALLSIFSANMFSAAFSGYAGIKGDITSNEASEKFDPIMNMKAYFAGELDFSPQFLVRAEFSIQTADVLDTGLFEETDAVFCIDEFSATYIKPFLGITQYISAFIGTFEPIGTDVFLQRHFGIQPITSMITESWLGLKGSTVYPFYGIGGSYVIHINSRPIATGLYIYKNEENDEDINQLNIDLRFAAVTDPLSIDIAAGIGAPLDSKNGTEDVILLVDKLYLHTGIDLLLGNRYTQSMFIQAGFDNLPVKAGNEKTEIRSDDIYLIVEPRLYTKNFRAHLTVFSVPKESAEKFIFIDDTFGANLTIFTDRLYIRNTDFTFGFHTTLSFPDRDFYDLKRIKELKDDDYTIKVSPFLSVPIMTGTLKTMLQVKINKFRKSRWQDQFKLSIGYKSQI